MINNEETKKHKANIKMNPPLRSEKDRQAIENAVLDGTIDCIATDHAPHESEKKKDFKTALNGVIGLQTLLPCTLTNFYYNQKLNLPYISKILSKNPANILKIKNKGEILKGNYADIILVDINKSFTFKESDIVSKSKNSPFLGKRLKGEVIKTFCNGEITYNKI